jgi:hypothetical protein
MIPGFCENSHDVLVRNENHMSATKGLFQFRSNRTATECSDKKMCTRVVTALRSVNLTTLLWKYATIAVTEEESVTKREAADGSLPS